ncbi:hypothetical protein LIER_35196 [Lithospermum erythrorhizon]|uniref:Uncharacterized protein n=1 Tax=Lithospermum erythrorhizon TaxID=34254 RepID=A0AAV3NMW2_LITER
MVPEEKNLRSRDDDQVQHSSTDEGKGMYVLPTWDNPGKNRNLNSISTMRVASTEILVSLIRENKEGRNIDSHHVGVENIDGIGVDPEWVTENIEVEKPNVKDTFDDASFKSARSHSSVDPTVVVNPTIESNKVDYSKKNQDDDDVVVVSSTASRRRTRTSVTALEKKRVALGIGGDMGESVEPIDLEDLEELIEKKKVAKKGKSKTKMPCSEELKGGSMPKKMKRVVISEPSQGRNKDNFIVDDVEVSEKEDATCLARRKSKLKMKLNDDQNRINNRRIAKVVEDMDTEGMNALVGDIGPHWPSIVREFICNLSEDIVDSSSSMFHKVKLMGHVFNFSPTLINKHYERQNDGVTGSTLKLNDIIKTLTGGVLTEWPIKGQFHASVLSLKYAVMHKVAIANLDDPGEHEKPLTITVKLMYRKRVVDVGVKGVEQSAVVPEGEAAALLIKAYEEEQKTIVPLVVNDSVGTNNKAALADVAEPVVDLPTVNAPTSDAAEVLDDSSVSCVN